eukprot:15603-Heterococcus_DN1.PRE.1
MIVSASAESLQVADNASAHSRSRMCVAILNSSTARAVLKRQRAKSQAASSTDAASQGITEQCTPELVQLLTKVSSAWLR